MKHASEAQHTNYLLAMLIVLVVVGGLSAIGITAVNSFEESKKDSCSLYSRTDRDMYDKICR